MKEYNLFWLTWNSRSNTLSLSDREPTDIGARNAVIASGRLEVRSDGIWPTRLYLGETYLGEAVFVPDGDSKLKGLFKPRDPNTAGFTERPVNRRLWKEAWAGVFDCLSITRLLASCTLPVHKSVFIANVRQNKYGMRREYVVWNCYYPVGTYSRTINVQLPRDQDASVYQNKVVYFDGITVTIN